MESHNETPKNSATSNNTPNEVDTAGDETGVDEAKEALEAIESMERTIDDAIDKATEITSEGSKIVKPDEEACSTANPVMNKGKVIILRNLQRMLIGIIIRIAVQYNFCAVILR